MDKEKVKKEEEKIKNETLELLEKHIPNWVDKVQAIGVEVTGLEEALSSIGYVLEVVPMLESTKITLLKKDAKASQEDETYTALETVFV